MLYCLLLSCSRPFSTLWLKQTTIPFILDDRGHPSLNPQLLQKKHNTLLSVNSFSILQFSWFPCLNLVPLKTLWTEIPTGLHKSEKIGLTIVFKVLIITEWQLKRISESPWVSWVDAIPCHLNVLTDGMTIQDKPVGMVSICFTCFSSSSFSAPFSRNAQHPAG